MYQEVREEELRNKVDELQKYQQIKEEELKELLVKVQMLQNKEPVEDSGDMSNQLLDLVRRNQQLFEQIQHLI